jgi:hypothetical protein
MAILEGLDKICSSLNIGEKRSISFLIWPIDCNGSDSCANEKLVTIVKIIACRRKFRKVVFMRSSYQIYHFLPIMIFHNYCKEGRFILQFLREYLTFLVKKKLSQI